MGFIGAKDLHGFRAAMIGMQILRPEKPAQDDRVGISVVSGLRIAGWGECREQAQDDRVAE
jgi:hypothetical protein